VICVRDDRVLAIELKGCERNVPNQEKKYKRFLYAADV